MFKCINYHLNITDVKKYDAGYYSMLCAGFVVQIEKRCAIGNELYSFSVHSWFILTCIQRLIKDAGIIEYFNLYEI